MAASSRSHSAVLVSMSVSRNVTTPDGNPPTAEASPVHTPPDDDTAQVATFESGPPRHSRCLNAGRDTYSNGEAKPVSRSGKANEGHSPTTRDAPCEASNRRTSGPSSAPY